MLAFYIVFGFDTAHEARIQRDLYINLYSVLIKLCSKQK